MENRSTETLRQTEETLLFASIFSRALSLSWYETARMENRKRPQSVRDTAIVSVNIHIQWQSENSIRNSTMWFDLKGAYLRYDFVCENREEEKYQK